MKFDESQYLYNVNGVALVLTDDGSHTLYLPELDETYHSTHGAVSESIHVFIESGLKHLIQKSYNNINILEVGFGTGLNALLTFDYCVDTNVNINYNTIDNFVVSSYLIEKLNYPKFCNNVDVSLFAKMHQTDWNNKIQLSDSFSITKHFTDLMSFKQTEGNFDLVYFDAFAPSRQEEMWLESVFEKIYGLMNDNAILLTYSSAGRVRRAMESVGFVVEKIPGPWGKREMIRVKK